MVITTMPGVTIISGTVRAAEYYDFVFDREWWDVDEIPSFVASAGCANSQYATI